MWQKSEHFEHFFWNVYVRILHCIVLYYCLCLICVCTLTLSDYICVCTWCAGRLEAMYRSLHILASLPGDEDRQAQFKTLRETVLGNLRPRVQNDVNNNDLTSLQEYFHIYEKLGKKEELQQEYTLLRAKSLLYIWDLAPVADLVAGSSAGTASADSTPVKQQAAMALAVSMVAVKPAQFVTQWSEWLDKLEQGVATLLTRSHDDIVVLFGSSAESAGAAGVQRYYSSVLCKILLSALEQLPAVLLSVFQQMRSIQNTPTGATDLCYSTYVKINGIVSRCVYVHLQHADSAEVLSCLRVFYDAFVTWSGLSVHFPVVPAATLSARSGHYIADNERSIAHVLLNQKQSLQQLRFDVLVGAQTADASVAASSAAAASNSIVVSESLDISELFITFNDLLLSCSDFSAQEGDSGDRDSGGKGGTVLHRYLSRSVRFLHGIALRPMLTNVAGVLMLYVQGFTHRLKDLRAAFGLPVGIFQDADNSEYGETARLGSTPAKISSSLGSQRTAGSNHGDVASVLWAEKLAQKLQQQSGDDSSQGLGGGMYALGMNVSELVYTPSALKALQAVGRLARTLVQFEGDCVAQVATLGSELQVLLSIPVAESTGAAAGAVISADPGLDLVVQKLCQGNGSFARELTGFINLHCTRAAAAESAGAAGGSKHVNVFVSVFEQLGVLKGTIGGTVVDLFLRTPVRHFAQLAADKSLWAAPSPAEGGRLTDHVPQTSFTLYGEYMLTVIHEIESFVVNFNSVGADSAQEGAGVDHTGLADILSLNSQRLCTTLPARYWMRLQGQGGAGGLSVPATAHPAIRVVESALFGSALTGDAEIDEDPEWVSPDPGQTGLGLEGVEASQPISKYELLMHHYAGLETASQPNATPVAELEEDFIAHYVSNWCGAVNSSLLGVIFSEVYAIPVLSPLGLMQLRTDLIYTQ